MILRKNGIQCFRLIRTRMHTFITLNGVPTRVFSHPNSVEDAKPGDDIILVIPGNPGISQAYEHFLKRLHEKLGWSVCAIGHAGHERDFDSRGTEKTCVTDPTLFDLNGQIENKLDFFRRYIPDGARVHIIGHSIGAYIVNKLLADESCNKKIVKSYLMFPTIENIGDSPNGKIYQTVLTRLLPIISFLCWFFTILPSFLKSIPFAVYAFVYKVDRFQKQMIETFVDPFVIKHVFYMADDEMRNVKARDDVTIKSNLDKIKVYFGDNDGWAPNSYYEKLKKDIPEIDAEICKRNLMHSFCLKQSDKVADLVASWMLEDE